MLKKERWLPFLFIILFTISGCATAEKDFQLQALKERVSLLESQIEQKESQIAELNNISSRIGREKEELLNIIIQQDEQIVALTRGLKDKKKEKTVLPKSETKAYYSFVIKIQTALKNAGFQLGLIDGKMGSRTREALREFQKQNGLSVSGVPDKQTWSMLRDYL